MKHKMDNSIIITLIIVGAVVLLALIGLGFYSYSNPAKTISSNGMATIKALPDLVVVYFNIQTTGQTSDEASDKNAEIYDKMKGSLMDLGFSEEEIQTESFSVYPDYDWQSGTQRIKGYIATHSVKVEILFDNKDMIGETIDAGINAWAGISYINYELTEENQNKYEAEAIKKATENARTKAEAAAIGSGSKLGSVISVSPSFSYAPWIAFAEADVAKSSGTEIETQITPSEQEVSASVTAVYRIK